MLNYREHAGDYLETSRTVTVSDTSAKFDYGKDHDVYDATNSCCNYNFVIE